MDPIHSIQQNQIIKKKNNTNHVLNQSITQMESESLITLLDNPNGTTSETFGSTKPLEVTEEAKTKMRQLMDDFLLLREKMTKINQIRKELTT